MTEQEKGAGFGPGYAKSALTYILYIYPHMCGEELLFIQFCIHYITRPHLVGIELENEMFTMSCSFLCALFFSHLFSISFRFPLVV